MLFSLLPSPLPPPHTSFLVLPPPCLRLHLHVTYLPFLFMNVTNVVVRGCLTIACVCWRCNHCSFCIDFLPYLYFLRVASIVVQAKPLHLFVPHSVTHNTNSGTVRHDKLVTLSSSVCVCVCVFVCVCVHNHVAWWLKHVSVDLKFTGSSPTSYHWRKSVLHLAPHLCPSKTVNWGPGLG